MTETTLKASLGELIKAKPADEVPTETPIKPPDPDHNEGHV